MREYSFSEMELRNRYINKKRVNDVQLYTEVPVFSRSVDLVTLNVYEGSLSAIEFKLHDWKRAIQQVSTLSLCFDYLFICLPAPSCIKTVSKIKNACITNGIGLLLYNESLDLFELKCEAKKSDSIWIIQKNQVKKYLEGLPYA